MARYSKARGSFYVLKNGQSLLDGVAEICSQIRVDLCMPVDMDGIYYFAQHREGVLQYTNLFLMETAETLRLVWDKGTLAEYLCEKHLPHPLTITNCLQFEKNTSSLNFPVLVKPRLTGGGKGIVKYKKREELLDAMKDDFFEEFIIQEYIQGEDIDCSVLCRGGQILAYTIQKGLYVEENYLPAEVIEFVHHSSVLETAAEFMSALGWDGVAHIDMRIRASDGAVLIIEVNPRYWGSIEGSLHVGVNFPYLALLASRGENFPVPQYRDAKYMSALAAIKRKLRNKPTVDSILSETNFTSYLRDPLPVIMRLTQPR